MQMSSIWKTIIAFELFGLLPQESLRDMFWTLHNLLHFLRDSKTFKDLNCDNSLGNPFSYSV